MIEFQVAFYLKFDVFVAHDSGIQRKNRIPIIERRKTTDRTANPETEIQKPQRSNPCGSQRIFERHLEALK